MKNWHHAGYFFLVHFFMKSFFILLMIKGALSDLRQFLATENSLIMMKNALFYLKSFFRSQVFKFLYWIFSHVDRKIRLISNLMTLQPNCDHLEISALASRHRHWHRHRHRHCKSLNFCLTNFLGEKKNNNNNNNKNKIYVQYTSTFFLLLSYHCLANLLFSRLEYSFLNYYMLWIEL